MPFFITVMHFSSICVLFLAVLSLLLHGLCSSCPEQELLSSCGMRASRCHHVSRCGARALDTWAPAVAAQTLESRLGSRGVWTYLLPCGSLWDLPERGMWDLPGPGIEPMSLALAGGFLPTRPPGKPWVYYI